MAIGWYGTGRNIRDSFDRNYGAGRVLDGYGISRRPEGRAPTNTIKAGKCF